MPSLIIELTPEEIALAAFVGLRRRWETLSQGLKDKHGYDSSESGAWGQDVNGASAEMALAKMLNMYWGGEVNTFKLPDVGNVQVRSTTLGTGRLIIRPNDSDDDIFVLMIQTSSLKFECAGWIRGHRGKRMEFARSPSNRPLAYFVPQDKLSQNLEKLQDIMLH